jgi:hypothetical protein
MGSISWDESSEAEDWLEPEVSGVRGEGQAPLSEFDWFPWMGLAASAPIAAAMGWIAVPNSLVPGDTPDAHLRLAGAAVLAAAPWAYLLARSAPERPLRAAGLLLVATYLLGILTLGWCGVPFPAFPFGPGPGAPMDLAGYFCSLLPWIAVGAALWTASLMTLGPIDRPSLRSIGAQALLRNRGLQLFAVTLAVAALVGVAVPGVRQIGWTLQDPPAASRPEVAGVVAESVNANGSCRLRFLDGRSFEFAGYCDHFDTTVLFLGTDSPHPWHDFRLLWAPESTPDGGTCWPWSVEPWAWDRGDAILFTPSGQDSFGVELSKAPHFASWAAPSQYFSELVYGDSRPCVNEAGQIMYMAEPGYI